MGSSLSKSHLPRNYWPEETGQVRTSFDARRMVTTQFVKTPEGWKMSAMAWDDERPGLSIDA